jgi:hypothetical protein
MFSSLLLVGCGGGASESEKKEAAQAAVQRWVDNDDCSAASDSYLESSYPDEPDPRAACSRDTLKGVRRGDYRVESVQIDGDSARVSLKLITGSTRTYSVVPQDDQWVVDDLDEEASQQQAKIGDPLYYLDSFELDGQPIDVRLTVTVLAIEPAQPPEFYPSHGGPWFRAKVRVKSESSGPFYVGVSDFSLADQSGQQVQGNSAFEPPLARDSTNIATGDRLTGFVGFELPKGSKPLEVRYLHPASQGAPLIWPVS